VQVFFNNTQVPIITQQNERIAIVGIPLSTNEGNNSVILQAPDFMDTLSFNVEAKDYPEQRITSNKHKVIK
jgi:hypothetical protein